MEQSVLRIKRKDIYPEKSQLLYRLTPNTETLRADFEIAGGEWSFDGENLISFTDRENGGLIYSKKHYCGDVLLDFYGKTIESYDNDLNFTFCSNGWDYEKDCPKAGYLGGLQGWWIGKTGIEKTPYECNLEALTSMHRFTPGKEYHIQAGKVGNKVFVFVDGVMAVELSDPNPIERYGRVGLGSYASKIVFRDFKVLRPHVEPFVTTYAKMRNETDGEGNDE